MTAPKIGDRKLEREARELLRGAVDFHIHTAPDIFPRLLNDIEAARQAKRAGMRAIVIKSHVTITADRARVAEFVTGLPVFGGVTLNWQVGGLNRHAVDCAAKLGGRLVWMPTAHAAHYLGFLSQIPMFAKAMPMDVQGVRVLEEGGSLVPEVGPILEAVAANRMILGTGHVSPAEGIALIREARRAGVEKIVVTHPAAPFINYSLDQMREALDAGATFLEHVFNDCSPHLSHPIPPSALGDAIKSVGPEHCIMATDTGQAVNPPPVKMMASYIREMRQYGFSAEEIRTMTAKNPGRILGLE